VLEAISAEPALNELTEMLSLIARRSLVTSLEVVAPSSDSIKGVSPCGGSSSKWI